MTLSIAIVTAASTIVYCSVAASVSIFEPRLESLISWASAANMIMAI